MPKNIGKLEFSATIESAGGGGAFVTIPHDLEKVWNVKRAKVVATFDGTSYRGSAVRMGRPDWFLIVRKEIRKKIGKDIGDVVKVTMRKDTDERTVEVPSDLAKALSKGSVAKAFAAMSYTHRKEFVQWVDEAKKPETRERRIARTVEMIGEGKHR